ncbi:MAG: gamma-glutamyltransferase [Wenzhouxiangellaceae bacterium]
MAHADGHLGDLHRYRMHWRRPIGWNLDGRTRIWSNPPPAFGGIMVALMTRALEDGMPPHARFGSDAHLDALVEAMRSSEDHRHKLERPECQGSGTALLRAWKILANEAPRASRGTTHISVRDPAGNIAGMTLSNGEGCGRAVPGCGFMLNNMLGEQDLNPLGFHRWPTNRRISSMMAPTLVRRGDEEWVLGSGGSNRIRTAIAQVLANLMHFDMTPQQAVAAPRLHLEGTNLSLERGARGWPESIDAWLKRCFPDARRWPDRSLYFGGVQIAATGAAVADPRRMGEARELTLQALPE